jgi:hypothetical protein
LLIHGFKQPAVGCRHAGVVEKTAQQGWAVFGQATPTAPITRVVRAGVQPRVGDE